MSNEVAGGYNSQGLDDSAVRLQNMNPQKLNNMQNIRKISPTLGPLEQQYLSSGEGPEREPGCRGGIPPMQ